MKKITNILAMVAVFAFTFAASAQIGGISVPQVLGPFNGGTAIIGASTATNITAVNTNSSFSNCVVNVQDTKSFAFELMWKPMNGASNLVDVRWNSSLDGTNYPVASAGSASNRISGWFSTLGGDTTNSSGMAIFRTNIAITSEMNYWRLEYITNGSAVVISNVTAKAWKKRVIPLGP